MQTFRYRGFHFLTPPVPPKQGGVLLGEVRALELLVLLYQSEWGRLCTNPFQGLKLTAVGMGGLIILCLIEPSLSQSMPSPAPPSAFPDNSSPHEIISLPVQEADRPHELGEHSVEPALSGTAVANQSTPRPAAAPPTAPASFSPVQATTIGQPPPPAYLDPNPNPLQFPTQPEEVEIVGVQPITLQQALELARRNNRELQAAELTLERTRFALREAQAAKYPNLEVRSNFARANSANVELQNERQRQVLGRNAAEQDPNNSSLDGTVELSYDLYTSGSRPAQIRAAEAQVRLNELEVERLAEQLRFDVTDAYYNIQQADEQVRINQSAVASSEKSLKDAEALERGGVGTRFDVLRARVQLANAVQALTDAIADQRVQRRQLAQVLSVSQPVDLQAAEAVDIAGIWKMSLEESIVLAFKNRAELEQELVQRDIGEQQRLAALSALGPQVSVFANYNLQEAFDDDLNLADGYTLGARMRWNLYDGGAARARAKQQETSIAIAETRFANQRNQIRFQVEQAYYTLQSNYDNIQTAKVALEQARESLRLARLRFQAGVGTQSEVLDAETELTRAEGNQLRAIIGYNRAFSSMQRAITNLGALPSPVTP